MRKLVLNENNENVIRTNDAFKKNGMLTAVEKDAIDDVLKNDKKVQDMNDELLNISMAVTPANPGTGKKINMKPYTECKNIPSHRRYLSEDNNSLYQELLSFLKYKGFDTSNSDVKQYASAATEYISLSREYGDWYSIEDWYKDTKQNYPEELTGLKKLRESRSNRLLKKSMISEKINSKRLRNNTRSLIEAKKRSNVKFNVTDPSSPFFGKVYDDDEEEDEYTAVDLLNDRLFGYGLNKSNFRSKWKFAEIEPLILSNSGKLKRSYFYPTTHIDSTRFDPSDRRAAVADSSAIGVFVYNEKEAELAKLCAKELDLRFELRKNNSYASKTFPYTAVIYLTPEAEELPLAEYAKTIGKSINDFKRTKADTVRSDFSGHKNYLSRASNKKDQAAVEESLDLSNNDDLDIQDKILSEIYDKLVNLLKRYRKNKVDVQDIQNCCERAIFWLEEDYL